MRSSMRPAKSDDPERKNKPAEPMPRSCIVTARKDCASKIAFKSTRSGVCKNLDKKEKVANAPAYHV